MAIEFLLVTFPESRAVLADGVGVGFTNHMLMLPGDEYEMTLEGNSCAPASQAIALAGTSMVKPMVISFDPLASVALARGAVPVALAPEPAPAKPRAGRRRRAPGKSDAPPVRKKASKRSLAQAAPAATGKSVVTQPVSKAKKDA